MTATLLLLALASSVPEHYAAFGFLRARFAKSDVHIEQDAYGRDVTYEQLAADDDLRARKLDGYHFTQLQFYGRYGYRLWDNDFFEVSLSHLTYVARPGQTLRRKGTWNGETVDDVVTLANDIPQYEHSNGINVVGTSWVREVGALEVDDFGGGILMRAGPVIGLVNSNNEVRAPDGQVEKHDTHKSLHFGAYGATFGLALRASHAAGAFIEASSEATFLRVFKAKLTTGSARQDILALIYAVQLGWQW